MPYCMNCQTQFADGVTRCPDCGTELASDKALHHGWKLPTSPNYTAAYEPIELCALDDLVQLELIETQLRNLGIPNVRRPKVVALYIPTAFKEQAEQVMRGEDVPVPAADEPDTLSLSELHRLRLACSDCETETTVDLLNERVPTTCAKCGHYFDLSAARAVLDRYTDVMRIMHEADFEIELERPKEP